jgi:hypothetical protein
MTDTDEVAVAFDEVTLAALDRRARERGESREEVAGELLSAWLADRDP